jgi:hypothetical protein
MAEIRIPVENLSAPDKDGNHAFQFRIISVDKNQWSAWSQLYIVKSIGQYRPLESDVTAVISSQDISLTWDTPTYYNYDGVSNSIVKDLISGSIVSINSASIVAHNHSQKFKQHDSDVFVQWGSESSMGNFEYHDRVSSDNTSIVIPNGSASVRVIGTVALKDVTRKGNVELDEDYQARFDEYLGISGSVQGVYDLFKIFDTGIIDLYE